MKYPCLLRAAAVAAAMGAGAVFAQATPPVVVTDVSPPPAEDRSSVGAVVLENSLVRAQRDNAFQRSSSRTGVASVGRGVMRATMQAQREAETAQAREAQELELRKLGGPRAPGP